MVSAFPPELTNVSGPTRMLPAGSSAFKSTADLAAVPDGSAGGSSTSASEATIPLKVRLIVVGPLAAAVTCSAAIASFVPVAPGASYDVTVNVFVPDGTVALTVHVSGVVAVGAVQPGDCGVRFAVTSTTFETAFAMVSDCVDGLTYFGCRVRLELLLPAGTRITNNTVPFPAVVTAAGATDEPPPPPHAASEEANTNTKTARRN